MKECTCPDKHEILTGVVICSRCMGMKIELSDSMKNHLNDSSKRILAAYGKHDPIAVIKKRAMNKEYERRDIDYYEAQEAIETLLLKIELLEHNLRIYQNTKKGAL